MMAALHINSLVDSEDGDEGDVYLMVTPPMVVVVISADVVVVTVASAVFSRVGIGASMAAVTIDHHCVKASVVPSRIRLATSTN